MRVVPTSAVTTSMQYEVFRHRKASDAVFKDLDGYFKQVENEDKQLCNGVQRNLNAGVYVNGNLQPFNEKVIAQDPGSGGQEDELMLLKQGVLYFQELVKRNLVNHRREEESKGGEIWPSTRKAIESASLDEEIGFCTKLDCGSSAELAW